MGPIPGQIPLTTWLSVRQDLGLTSRVRQSGILRYLEKSPMRNPN